MTDRNEVRSQFIALLQPFVRLQTARPIDDGTHLVDDLNVNSARLVDIILETEEKFDIAIDDESAGRLRTVGDGVDVIMKKGAAKDSSVTTGGIRL